MRIACIHLLVINSAIMISCYDGSEIKSGETKNQIAFEHEEKAFFHVYIKEHPEVVSSFLEMIAGTLR